MLFHTIPEILSYANEAYGADDAIRWKKSKNEIESRTYSELKNDTDSFANAIEKLGKKGQHIAVIGPSSYEWIVSYLACLLYTSPSPRDYAASRMPSSA